MYGDIRTNSHVFPPLNPGATCRTTSGTKACAVTGRSQSSRCCAWWWEWHPLCFSSSSWSSCSLPRGCIASRTRTNAFASAGACATERRERKKMCCELHSRLGVKRGGCDCGRVSLIPISQTGQVTKCVKREQGGKRRERVWTGWEQRKKSN